MGRRRWTFAVSRYNAHAITRSDFPSGALMKERGIREVVLVQRRAGLPEADLHGVLRS